MVDRILPFSISATARGKRLNSTDEKQYAS